MSNERERASNSEPQQSDFGIMNEPAWNENLDAVALPFASLVPPARIETVEEAVEERCSPAPSPDFVASIREAIETLSCGENYPTIRRTAGFVGMSVRTLQRRLAQAGASYHMLIAQARFATAAAVLERTDAKILELALDLGYSDHANFTRAFRRWAGCAPREYRSRRAPHEAVADLSSPRGTGFGQGRASAQPPNLHGFVAISGACGAQ
jgi:AraC-like DNA-binding protein